MLQWDSVGTRVVNLINQELSTHQHTRYFKATFSYVIFTALFTQAHHRVIKVELVTDALSVMFV